ncbi:MAG: OmpA family protein [Pseudomonadales bacterium]|nr:OmpA family protein [Pseudomonadales bacterium]
MFLRLKLACDVGLSALIVKLAVSCMALFTASAHAVDIPTFNSAKVVFERDKKHDHHELVYSPINYLDGTQEEDQEGYSPVNLKEIPGSLHEAVYDHARNQSALNVFQSIKKRILADGMSIENECQRLDCGDIAGWQLFLSNYVSGDSAHQYYMLASKKDKLSTIHLAIYVVDIGEHPRSIIHQVKSEISPEQSIVNIQDIEKQLNEGNKVDMPGVLFDFDSSQLNEVGLQSLVNLVEVLASQSVSEIKVIGHTDNLGSLEYNMGLSSERAQSVASFLQDAFEDKPLQVSLHGKGPLEPKVTNDTPANRQMNRRVEVQVVR